MPVLNLNVEVYEMGTKAEGDLSKIGKIRGKCGPINTYYLDLEVPPNSPDKILESYKKLLSKLRQIPNVKYVEKSAELEKLNA